MKDKVLITGATGFVGKYLIQYLKNIGIDVYPAVRKKSAFSDPNVVYIDLLDERNVNETIAMLKPTHVIHLAALSNVGNSWADKQGTLTTNIIGTVNLFEALRKHSSDSRIVSIGSSEEYGLVEPAETPIKETNPVRPMSPYGASKLTVCMLALQYARAYKMNIVHTRTFNHIGPGQSLGFVTQDFAKEISNIERFKKEPVLHVGNLEAIRDFTDVRDIVVAYGALLNCGVPGEIYNVCSNNGVKIREILEEYIGLSSTPIEIIIDPDKLRPSDVPVLIGDNGKLYKETKWTPEIKIKQSLEDILNFYRRGS